MYASGVSVDAVLQTTMVIRQRVFNRTALSRDSESHKICTQTKPGLAILRLLTTPLDTAEMEIEMHMCSNKQIETLSSSLALTSHEQIREQKQRR